MQVAAKIWKFFLLAINIGLGKLLFFGPFDTAFTSSISKLCLNTIKIILELSTYSK